MKAIHIPLAGLLTLVCSCSSGSDVGATGSAAGNGGGAGSASGSGGNPASPDSSTEGMDDASAAFDAPAQDVADEVSTVDAASIVCNESYNVPPVGLAGWSPVLSQTGTMTLTHDAGHLHDDGLGPLGFCPASVAPGKRYLALVSARFETDQNDKNLPNDLHCITDYTQIDPTLQQYGMCWSGGNVAIYVEVRDEKGARAVAGFEAFITGMTIPISDQGKPAQEFPMNFAMSGHGNQRYGARAKYTVPNEGALPSDVVTNMRLVLNHHVNYLLTFQVKTK